MIYEYYQIKLNQSVYFFYYLILFDLLFIFATLFSNTFTIIKLLILLSGINYSVFIWHKYIKLKAKNSVIEIKYIEDNSFELKTLSQEKYKCNLRENTVITRFAMFLNFANENSRKKFSVIIFPDAINKLDYKKMQMLLLYYKT